MEAKMEAKIEAKIEVKIEVKMEVKIEAEVQNEPEVDIVGPEEAETINWMDFITSAPNYDESPKNSSYLDPNYNKFLEADEIFYKCRICDKIFKQKMSFARHAIKVIKFVFVHALNFSSENCSSNFERIHDTFLKITTPCQVYFYIFITSCKRPLTWIIYCSKTF